MLFLSRFKQEDAKIITLCRAAILFFALTACDAALNVKSKGGNRLPASVAEEATIISLDNYAPKTGEKVVVIGENFKYGLSIIIGDAEVPLEVINATTATFVMPNITMAGLVDIQLKAGNHQVAKGVSLFNNSANDDLPIAIIDPSLVCQSTSFRNQKGEIVTGTAVCGRTSTPSDTTSNQAPNCQQDGQINCLTTSSFKAVV